MSKKLKAGINNRGVQVVRDSIKDLIKIKKDDKKFENISKKLQRIIPSTIDSLEKNIDSFQDANQAINELIDLRDNLSAIKANPKNKNYYINQILKMLEINDKEIKMTSTKARYSINIEELYKDILSENKIDLIIV